MPTTDESWLKTPEQLMADRASMISSYFGEDGQIFNNPHGAGYWLHGVAYDAELGWLAYVFDERDDDLHTMDHAFAIRCWKNVRSPLPTNYWRLGTEILGRVFINGVRKWGQSWIDDADLPRMDEVLQYTLLGEIRYG